MSKQIFPAEIVAQTTQYHFQQHSTRTRIIYQIVLLFIVCSFIAIYFIDTKISVNGRGMLSSITDRNSLKAPVSGRIGAVLIKDNMPVKKGDILFTLEVNILEQQADYINRQQTVAYRKVSDLEKLTELIASDKKGDSLELETGLYRQQLRLFEQQVKKAALEIKNTRGVFERKRQLHRQHVISDAEFEEIKYDLNLSKNKAVLLVEQQGNQWQSDLSQLRLELRDLLSQENKFAQEKSLYTVRAPIDGTIQRFSGIRPGSFVGTGEVIAEISPDSGLVADIFISPKDIGLIKSGMDVRMQIDAFNYNQWGLVIGKVTDITNDVIIIQENSPVFRVRCKLNKNTLSLPNGYTGRLKKGMTLQARFTVAERTLFQLLYDNVDDWLNPAQNNPENSAKN